MTSENKGQIALVTGGSRGIGRAIAIKLAQSGFDIWLTYKSNQEAALETQSVIKSTGVECELFQFDISSFEETEQALKEKVEKNTPYILVHNSGITRDNLLLWMTPEEWNSVIDTNLNGFYNVTRNVLFGMLKARKGRIVVISSTSGEIGQAGQVNYAASKGGLIAAAKSLAREVGKRNIIVNVVSPGFIKTDMTSEIPEEKVMPLIPLNRIGAVEDVASVVNFLCTEERMYIHGQVIGVNGGLAI
ncbi:MAG: 3-oxoacyl-ACP reductase FabG [Nitrospinota bacterium]|nr:3-oxoacyl-ACP reductase FabG [Nitrospinota bacterium]MDH5677549.1 3-oxoacyl-ACP reductase FabG [Nitrospinota bacterium]MDH5757705.1 3-oxoacyl-ACP reductase FabG [Nitrospinota bacterium]